MWLTDISSIYLLFGQSGQQVLLLLLFILPAYVANAAPVLLGGLYPIDRGIRLWDGRPVFGPSKTWLGLVGGLSAGMLCAVLEAHLLRGTPFDLFAGQASYYLLSGFLLCIGALAGDLLGSFIKRRRGFGAGQPSFIWDQLTFLAVALLLVQPLGLSIASNPYLLAFLFAFTYLVHRLANLLAHSWGIKKVPW
ncbi:MAG: CDP-2,3-bis-(O-geranylgeranyl)-sn-glycerol synthase [Candidatus Micrarchaeota archaeon]